MLLKRWFWLLLTTVALCACGGGGDDSSTGGGEGAETPSPSPDDKPDDPQPENPDAPEFFSTGFMKGSTMSFAQYVRDLGLVYRENGVETDPYESMKRHGANIVRLQLNYEGAWSYQGQNINWAAWNRVVADAKRAKANGLDVMLTLKPDVDNYAVSPTQHNLLPAAWKSLSEDQIGQKLYDWVYKTLCDLAKEEIYPRVVAVGNEVNVNLLGATTTSDASRTGRLLVQGFAAVRAYAKEHNPHVQSMLHLADPAKVGSYLRRIVDAGAKDFDLLGVSWYPGTNIGHTMGGFQNIPTLCGTIKNNFGYEVVIVETAASFTTGSINGVWQGDNCNNAYNYPDWNDDAAVNAANYTPANQRAWLRKLAEEVKTSGGVGVITWGTESLPDRKSNPIGYYTYPASWANGSTWENNSYWDFTNQNNLHEGIDWMLDVQ